MTTPQDKKRFRIRLAGNMGFSGQSVTGCQGTIPPELGAACEPHRQHGLRGTSAHPQTRRPTSGRTSAGGRILRGRAGNETPFHSPSQLRQTRTIVGEGAISPAVMPSGGLRDANPLALRAWGPPLGITRWNRDGTGPRREVRLVQICGRGS
ncbi:hypothetical protein VUR80DRAFT_4087 [Thermomyces stellatus]